MNDDRAKLEALPAFDDPHVQIVYRILCDTDLVPPPDEHWERFTARHVVAALASAQAASAELVAPIEASELEDMARIACEEALAFGIGLDSFHRLAKSVMKRCATPAPAVAPTDPLDTPLPCKVDLGGMSFGKGVALRTLIDAARRWREDAYGPKPSPEEAARNLALLQGAAVAVTDGQIKYVPVDSRLRDANWRHPNDDEPCPPGCREALDQRGDDEGQGLDGYWKWGFKAGWNACAALATRTPEPQAGWKLVPVEPTMEMMRAAVVYANGNAVYKNVAAEALAIEESIYGEVWAAMLAAAGEAK